MTDWLWEIRARWQCVNAPRFWFCRCKPDPDFEEEVTCQPDEENDTTSRS